MRTTEELLAAAEERLRLTGDLPSRIESIHGTARNAADTVAATVTVHGALTDLSIMDTALAMGPERLGAEIVRLAAAANRTALVHGLGTLSRSLGDAGTIELARSVGLGDVVDPPAPVVPYPPGVDPNAHRWHPVTEPTPTSPPDDDDYAMTFDFNSLRSDR